MKKIWFSVLIICILLIVGCQKSTEIFADETRETGVKPSFAVLADGDSKLVLLDQNIKVVKEIKNDNKFQNFSIDEKNKRIYALDDGTYMGTAPSILIINYLSGEVEKKIKLPNIPSSFLVIEDKAYIPSSEIFKDGIPFFVVNLKNGEVEQSTVTKGMVSTIKQYNDQIYVTVNSGGADLFGEFSNIYNLQLNNNEIMFTPVIKDNIELPPSDFIMENGKIYCIFTGFSYGPKPEWVKDPERYTNKFMVIDMNSGKIQAEKTLSKPFPQKLISIENYFYVNNYTDLDMKGEFITTINKNDLEESFIPIKSPAYFEYNSKLKEFLVSNPENGTVHLLKDGKIVKKVKVGANSSIVKSTEK